MQALHVILADTRTAARTLLGKVGERATGLVMRWTINAAIVGLILSLPVAASAASSGLQGTGSATPLTGGENAPRAQQLARGASIAAGRSVVTVDAQGDRPIIEYTLGPADSIASLASFFKISAEAIAYANGITEPANLEVGRVIRIPPAEGALHTVAEGESVESLATRFRVQADAIVSYNRLRFEPEHFAVGKLVFVPDARLPALVYPEPVRPSVLTRPLAPAARAVQPAGGWPVAGVITQYMGGGHTGVDIAAPYGTPLVSVIAGTVTATGWVAIGGLRVCVTGGGVEHCYYHVGAVFVNVGQAVERGQTVASIGMTGVTTGPHVHWETKIGGRNVNPLSN